MEVAYLTGGRETTKGVILNVLASEWPLSIKRIFFNIKKVTGKSLTYQAVYKSVKELLDDGVLSRQEDGYVISPSWIQKSGEFINSLAEAYDKSGIGAAQKIQELNFNSWGDAWDFIMSRIETNFFGESKEAYVQIRRFFLVPVSKEDIGRLKSFFSKKEVYIMCRSNSLIDKIAAGFLSSLGANVKTGIECARPTSVLVYGGCVASFYVTGEKERAQLNEYYKQATGVKTPKAGMFNLYKRMKIKLLINRDPGVLSDVLEQTKSIFSKHS